MDASPSTESQDPLLGSRFSDDSDLEGESDLDMFGFSDVLPGVDDLDAWEALLPLSRLPPLPDRNPKFWTQAFAGSCVVFGLCITFVVAARNVRGDPTHWSNPPWCNAVDSVMSCFALLALFCTSFIIFGRQGEICRSKATCYPIPAQVAKGLLAGQRPPQNRNILAPEHHPAHGSYCVRCLVWRPRDVDSHLSHHCRICQRCFVEFDHHCGVFGRCIVEGNMPCFATNIALLVLAMLAMFLTNGWCGELPDELYE
ncbi:pfa4 [Symbiodinium sp. CCMP2592]|nr:pfa4 [Symbiodinium sp. CCMP2592]